MQSPKTLANEHTPSIYDCFRLLHPQVQQLWKQQDWRTLRPIQQLSIPPVLKASSDVLIIAGTASGKTEAAWMPIFSRLLADPRRGIGVLCVSPLKALIDDQVKRLSGYGSVLGLVVEGWHGDISASRKKRILREPPAAVVITPESLQGLLLRHRDDLQSAAADLRYIVVDEVHAFIGTTRGQQLQSLLMDLQLLLKRPISVVALSATINEPRQVAEFLRPGRGGQATIEIDPASTNSFDVRVLGFKREKVTPSHQLAAAEKLARNFASQDRLLIARDIDVHTRGKKALIFSGSRASVEELALLLRDKEVTGTSRPDRFCTHHGSLSHELRESAVQGMHDERDAVTVCTSTLELGVDLPSVDLVAQVDTCLTVAGLRQRMGRSGRQPGSRPSLRVYCAEVGTAPEPWGLLRPGLMQSIATIELMRNEEWVEPPDLRPLGLSTLVHQLLCFLHHTDGASQERVEKRLCRVGQWDRVPAEDFARLVAQLIRQNVVRKDERGRLVLDEAGHRLVGHRSFQTVFSTPVEYVVRHAGKELGRLPVSYPLATGSTLGFGGRLWQVIVAHEEHGLVDVMPHTSGLPPFFKGGFGHVHKRVRQQMREVYESDEVPQYLDELAAEMFCESREAYGQLGLDRTAAVDIGSERSLLALFSGDREHATIERWVRLVEPGLNAQQGPLGLVLPVSAREAHDLAVRLQAAQEPTEAASCLSASLR